MTATVANPTQKPAAAARAALIEADWDWKSAAEILGKRLRKDKELRDAMLEPWVSKAVWDCIRKTAQAERRPFWSVVQSNAAKPDPASTEADKGLAALSNSNLYNYMLSGGKKLGQATAAEVRADGEYMLKQSKTLGIRGRWLMLIADEVPDDMTVRDVFTPIDLERLQERAIEEAA